MRLIHLLIIVSPQLFSIVVLISFTLLVPPTPVPPTPVPPTPGACSVSKLIAINISFSFKFRKLNYCEPSTNSLSSFSLPFFTLSAPNAGTTDASTDIVAHGGTKSAPYHALSQPFSHQDTHQVSNGCQPLFVESMPEWCDMQGLQLGRLQ